MQRKHGLTIQVTATHEGLEASDEKTRFMLFSTARELLLNVTKHAKTKTANVKVQRVGHQIQIVVEDNGVGCVSSESNPPGSPEDGLGLFNIRKRLNFFGGRFEIDSAPGKSSRFMLLAPVDPRVTFFPDGAGGRV